MAGKPILFNTEMVKAILDGRKTQTRRLVKEIPLDAPYFEDVDGVPMACDENGDWHLASRFSRIQPGDILWVRETWTYAADGGYLYSASYRRNPFLIWRPSIHMPRKAARLFLRVNEVRIERLQDIKPLDVKAEGIKIDEADEFDVEVSPEAMERFAFEELWDSTVKHSDQPRYGWDANPWVWVIEFERVKGERAGEWADRDAAQWADQDVLMPAT